MSFLTNSAHKVLVERSSRIIMQHILSVPHGYSTFHFWSVKNKMIIDTESCAVRALSSFMWVVHVGF